MRFQCTEKSLKDAGYNLSEGDTITVPDELGAYWCGLGWGKDVDGNVETGERKPGVHVLDVETIRTAHGSTVKGG